MKVVVASVFRNAAHYVERYFRQLEALSAEGFDVECVIAEGDSYDDTWGELERWLTPQDKLVKAEHGGPSYGSIDHPDRWKQMAWVCNQVMEELPDDESPKIYVESDLVWTPPVMVKLLEDLGSCDAVAPMSMRHGVFYDVWGHRGVDGERFHFAPPFHADLDNDLELVPIASAGSCIAMRPEIAKVARFSEEDCIVGLCRSIREHGGLWVDKTVAVEHP